MQTNPVKAIREKCLDCCCGSATEVNLCEIHDCALYPFRLGKNPFRREWSEERKAQQAERMKQIRQGSLSPAEEKTQNAE